MGNTFLSHSSKDDDLVIGATRVLENHGARVYVDEVDPVMPPYTTEEDPPTFSSAGSHKPSGSFFWQVQTARTAGGCRGSWGLRTVRKD